MTQINKQVFGRIKALQAEMEEIANVLEETAQDAQDYFDDKSESWQEGEKGEEYNTWISMLEDTKNNLDTAIASLEVLTVKPGE